MNKSLAIKDKYEEPFEKMEILLDKLIAQSGTCLGDKCPQFSQIKVKQNVFMTIILAFITILIGVSTISHIELGSFKEYIHVAELSAAGAEADLSRQVKGLIIETNKMCTKIKINNNQLNRIKLDVERLKVKLP